MKRVSVTVKNNDELNVLLKLLKSQDLDVDIQVDEREEKDIQQRLTTEDADFFSLAGIWAGRGVNVYSIRRIAWPRQAQ